MKVTNELIDRLQAEIDKLTPIQDSYSKKEINKLIRDIKRLLKEKQHIEDAKAEKKISKDEAEVASAKILLKEAILGIATIKALSYLRDRLFINTKKNKKPKGRYFITLKRLPE